MKNGFSIIGIVLILVTTFIVSAVVFSIYSINLSDRPAPEDNSDKHNFGSCISLIYNRRVDESINFVFIPSRDTQNKEILRTSSLALFDENERYSFYSIAPYNRYKTYFNFFYLDEYNIDSPATAKRILKEKCPVLSENVHQILFLEAGIAGIANNYLEAVNKIGYQTVTAYSDYINKKPRLVSLHIFLHEIGHSFGGLPDNYCQQPYPKCIPNIMSSGSDSVSFVDGFEASYGPAGEKQIGDTIRLLLQWANAKKRLKNVDIKVAESYIANFDNRDRIYAKFKISDDLGNTIPPLFSDEFLDPVISIKYKKPEETNYYEIDIIKKDVNGDYYIDITNYKSEKDLPLYQVDIIIKINLPKMNKSWSFKVKPI